MSRKQQVFVGIEGGATRTVALAVTAEGKEVGKAVLGPANVRLLQDGELVTLLEEFRKALPRPTALAIGLAGAWTPQDRKRIRSAAAKVWPKVPCYATHDLETALATTNEAGHTPSLPQILIVSGTGSCCYGTRIDGREIKVGGWGHILGDKGSAYEIGLRGLKASVFYYDRDGRWPKLGARLLRALELNEPNELIGWAQGATKLQIAGVAMEVFAAWKDKDTIANDILQGAATSLTRDGITCATRATAGAESRRQKMKPRVEFVLAGSNLVKQKRFAALVSAKLKRLYPGCTIRALKKPGVWGAVKLAREHFGGTAMHETGAKDRDTSSTSLGAEPKPKVQSRQMSPTEMRNPRSLRFDRLSTREAVELMLREETTVPKILLQESESINTAVGFVIRAFKSGGRLFYVGAGTSGRLGVLDASECPPTFRTEPELVQGIIAGGESALRRSVEGAEDDPAAGARAMEFHLVNKRDVVVGIAASGTTPFVWGAIEEAKTRGARTVLICFNPYVVIPQNLRPSVVIAPNLGPEVLTGSTRLKAGTATKLILNILTTVSMVGIGKVMSNLMIDLHPANVKLRDRATRIVRELTGFGYDTAWKALERNSWVIKKAVAQRSKK
jgi:N-acetylmuramic acid 6-phosphate etherase